jgi:hypothetical protein
MTVKIDATRPLYALVGAGDLAVEFARSATADVQARFAKIELEPKALRDQARTVVTARIDELNKAAKSAPATVESRAKETRSQLEGYVNEAVAEVTEAYGDLATRGQSLVSRIRRQQATQDAKAAAKSTRSKAKTAQTQTTKSAQGAASTAKKATKSTAGTAKQGAKSTSQAAKKSGSTAKSNAKSTTTAAKKTAETTTKAASDAAEKVGD